MAGSGGASGIGGPRSTIGKGTRIDTARGAEKSEMAEQAEKKNLGGAALAQPQEAATSVRKSSAQRDSFEPAKAQRMDQLMAPARAEPAPTEKELKAVKGLSARGQAAVEETVDRLKKNDLEGAKTAFEGIAEKGLKESDVNLVVSHTLRRSFPEAITEGHASTQNLDDQIEKWDEQLSTVGDDAQLANIDMQSALQKQQQTVQTLSNVSKALHDTALAVIRKIG